MKAAGRNARPKSLIGVTQESDYPTHLSNSTSDGYIGADTLAALQRGASAVKRLRPDNDKAISTPNLAHADDDP